MEKTDYTRGTPLRVFWVDSCHAPGWQYGDDYDLEVERIVTMGFVTASTDEGLLITSSLSRKGGILAPLVIPWGVITDIQEMPHEWHRDRNLPAPI